MGRTLLSEEIASFQMNFLGQKFTFIVVFFGNVNACQYVEYMELLKR
jgi:hypothetical protein